MIGVTVGMFKDMDAAVRFPSDEELDRTAVAMWMERGIPVDVARVSLEQARDQAAKDWAEEQQFSSLHEERS